MLKSIHYWKPIFRRLSPIQIILPLYSLLFLLVLFTFEGTGDAGDSIHHYLYARYAPYHPELFFDHWAKPLYVLLAAPFAAFGFEGVKGMNILASIGTAYFVFRSAQKLNLPGAWMASLIHAFSPLTFILTLSGLTEPLFALFLSVALWAALDKKYFLSVLLVSFLPFIRSEGLLLLGVFGVYLLLLKKWKLIPWLLTGHLVYSAAGYFVHHDILWVFTKIPYANAGSPYGSGRLMHFTEQMIYVTGIPVYLLFWVGVLALITDFLRKKARIAFVVLVAGGFFVFLVAHSLFWYYGIFNSMGLKRVMVGISPLTSLIALSGFNTLTHWEWRRFPLFPRILQYLLTAYILIFPFTGNPAALHPEKDLALSPDQKAARTVAQWIQIHVEGETCYFYAHPYLSMVLKLDHFDPSQRQNLVSDFRDRIKPGDILIWESWFSVVESGISLDTLTGDPSLEKMYEWKGSGKTENIHYVVFRHKEK